MSLQPKPPFHVVFAMCLLAAVVIDGSGAPPYENDPDITAQIEALEPGASLLLPQVTVEAGGLSMHGMDRKGPGQRDYFRSAPRRVCCAGEIQRAALDLPARTRVICNYSLEASSGSLFVSAIWRLCKAHKFGIVVAPEIPSH